MAEAIFKRMQRAVSAGLESVADAAERLNGNGMMRHAIREVDQAIDHLRGRLETAQSCARQADWRQAAIADQVRDLAQDARFAMEKGREDLAQVALGRQLDLEEQSRQLKRSQREAEREAAQLEASVNELRARKAQMEQDYAALEAAKREAQALGQDPKTERKVKRAEAAFERARSAAGCATSPVHMPAPPEVQEIKAARREDEIAARMAALRGAPAAAAPKPGKKQARG